MAEADASHDRQAAHDDEVRFRLVGADCTSTSCSLVLGRHLAKVPGILDFYVNPMNSMVSVRFDPIRTSADEIAVAVKSTGFKAIGPIMPRRAGPLRSA